MTKLDTIHKQNGLTGPHIVHLKFGKDFYKIITIKSYGCVFENNEVQVLNPVQHKRTSYHFKCVRGVVWLSDPTGP